MSRRRELARRLDALSDIADILGAMKSLAMMEIHILLGFITCQDRMVAGIEAALGEFLAWHPELFQPPSREGEDEGDNIPWPPGTTNHEGAFRSPAPCVPERALWVLVGSEQGFCGDLNARLAAWVRNPGAQPLTGRWLVVGQRLATKLGDDPRILLQLPGAIVADEVPKVLLRLTRELSRLLSADGVGEGGLVVLYLDEATNDLRSRPLLPLGIPPSLPGAQDPFPPEPFGHIRVHAFPPVIHLSPRDLLDGLTRHYLYAVLNQILYSSLLAENRQRQAHMDQALQRLQEKAEGLRRSCNAQRQEEITEEIEILLLSADPQE